MKKKVLKPTKRKKSFKFIHVVVVAIAILGLIVIGKNLVSSGLRVLGAQTLLAKGGDDSGGDDHGGGGSSGSGSSGNSGGSGSSGGGSSSGSGSSGGNSGSGSGGSGSGSSSGGSGGSSSDGTSVSDNTKVMCTGPDGKQFETKFKDCEELNKAWHKSVNFTTLPNQAQRSTVKVEDRPKISSVPSISHTPELENKVENENPETSPTATNSEEQNNTGITKVQLEENKTRVEQIIFENGVKKKVEMRNENGRIRIRVKTEDEATGTETDQRLELRPEDGIARLKVEANGIEQSVKIKAENDLFVIEQEGISENETESGTESATTNLPITIDPETNSIGVTTQFGTINVQQLPADAIQRVLSSNTIDTVSSAELGEAEKSTTDLTKQVVYRIAGVKNTKFLGIFKVNAPVLAEVSAITGKQIFVNQPWYLNAFGFLFTK